MPSFTAAQRGLATIDVFAPSTKRLIGLSGLTPPLAASPGELRLWLKMNGLLTDDKPGPKASKPVAVRKPPAGNNSQLQPIARQPARPGGSAGGAGAAVPGKTGGIRGGRAGRSGSVAAALEVAKGKVAQENQSPPEATPAPAPRRRSSICTPVAEDDAERKCTQCSSGLATCAMPGCGCARMLCGSCYAQVSQQRSAEAADGVGEEGDTPIDVVLRLMCRECTPRNDGTMLGHR